MAGPWEKYAPPTEGKPWEKYAPQEPYSGAVLPFSKDERGRVSFDMDAGLPGAVKRAFTLPGEVYSGEVDPMSDEGIGRAAEMGAIVSPVSAGARGGQGWAGARTRNRPPPAPTTDSLKKAGDFGFGLVRQMGVDYDAGAVQNLMAATRSDLFSRGLIEELAPKSFTILKKLEQPPQGGVASISGLHAARQALGNAAMDFANPQEQLVASRIIRALDKFIEKPDPASVVAGPAAAAGRIWSDAKANIAAKKRSDRLHGIEESAGRRADAANSGLNLDNTIRQRVASVLDSPKKRAGFSPEEIAMLETVSRGTAPRNVIRYVGNLLGGGGGLGAAIVGGAGYMGGGMGGGTGLAVGLGLPALGLGAKVGSNRLTRKALGRADEAVRMRSPLYKNSQPMSPVSPDARAAIGRTSVAEALGGAPLASPVDPKTEAIIRALMPKQPMSAEDYEAFLAGGGA